VALISFSLPTNKNSLLPKDSPTNPVVAPLAAPLKKLRTQAGADTKAENVKCILRSAILVVPIPPCLSNQAVISRFIAGIATNREELTKLSILKPKPFILTTDEGFFFFERFSPPSLTALTFYDSSLFYIIYRCFASITLIKNNLIKAFSKNT
jgi:hypothetical protein